MKILKQNITDIYGSKGEDWITSLPSIIAALEAHWNLTQVIPVSNMTFNYVARAILNANQPVIVKISYDIEAIANERQALINFDSQGSIKLIDFNQKYNALLLQQAIPGITLKSLYPMQADYVMNCYIETLQKLHSKELSNKHEYPHISDWLTICSLTQELYLI